MWLGNSLFCDHNNRSMISATPKSWYFACQSQDLKKGEHRFVQVQDFSVQILRDLNGKIHALSGQCPHMKTQFQNGFDPKRNILVCPMHHWVYNLEGKCLGIPGASVSQIPDWAQLKTYPVVEKFGAVFFFLSQEAHFDFPFFEDLNPEQVWWGQPFAVEQDNKWYVGPANGFDLHHFQFVHHRRVLDFQIHTARSIFNRKISIHFENVSQKIQDRLVRWIFGSMGRLDFSVWGGNFVLATLNQGSLKNYMMIINRPVHKEKSVASFLIFKPQAPKMGFRFFERVQVQTTLMLQSLVTRLFFEDEAAMAKGVDLPQAPGPRDQVLWDYKQWLENLSQEKQI